MRFKQIISIIFISVLIAGTISAENYESTTTLNVRQGPSKENDVVFKLKKGDKVVLVKKYDEEWYEIEYNGKKGYVYKEYLTLAGINKSIDRNFSYKGLSTKEIVYILLGVIILAIMLVVIISSFNKQNRTNENSGAISSSKQNYSRPPKYKEIRSTKSVALAVILVVLFGPLGMFYSTVKGALIMTFLAPVLFGILFLVGLASDPAFFILFGIGILIYYPMCLIWSGRAASNYNQKL